MKRLLLLLLPSFFHNCLSSDAALWPQSTAKDSSDLGTLHTQLTELRDAHSKLMKFAYSNHLFYSVPEELSTPLEMFAHALTPVEDESNKLQLSESDTRALGNENDHNYHSNGDGEQRTVQIEGAHWLNRILRRSRHVNITLPTLIKRPSYAELLQQYRAVAATENSEGDASAGDSTGVNYTSIASIREVAAEPVPVEDELTTDDLDYIQQNALELIRSEELYPLVKNITKMDNKTSICLEETCPSALLFCILSDDCMRWGSSLTDKCHFYASDVCGTGCPKEFVDIWACFHDQCMPRKEVDDNRPAAVKFLVENGEGLTLEEVEMVHNVRDESLRRKNTTARRRNFGGGYGDDNTNFKSKGHTVSWMTPFFEELYPELYSKLIQYGLKANVTAGWNVPANRTGHGFHVRCMEFLEYKVDELTGEGDSLGWHTDHGSLMTLLVMLSDPEDYTGGILQHEQRCRVASSPLKKGDVAVYRAYQRHRVSPVISGHRKVMVIEWWPFEKVGLEERPDVPLKRLPDDSNEITTLHYQLQKARSAFEDLTRNLIISNVGRSAFAQLNETVLCSSNGSHCTAFAQNYDGPDIVNSTTVKVPVETEFSFLLTQLASSMLPRGAADKLALQVIVDRGLEYATRVIQLAKEATLLRSLPVPLQQLYNLVLSNQTATDDTIVSPPTPFQLSDLVKLAATNSGALNAHETRAIASAELREARFSVLAAEKAIASYAKAVDALKQLEKTVYVLIDAAKADVDRANDTVLSSPYLPIKYVKAVIHLNHTERLDFSPFREKGIISTEGQRDAKVAAAVTAAAALETKKLVEEQAFLDSLGSIDLTACMDNEMELTRVASAVGLPANSCAAVVGTNFCENRAIQTVCPASCGLCESNDSFEETMRVEVESTL